MLFWGCNAVHDDQFGAVNAGVVENLAARIYCCAAEYSHNCLENRVACRISGRRDNIISKKFTLGEDKLSLQHYSK